MKKILISCDVNGEMQDVLVDPRDSLLDLLRDRLQLTGTKEGCGNGNCGSCTVLVDGAPANACLMLAQEAENHAIVTIEGLARDERARRLQDAIVAAGGTQCGFCTPGIVVSALALLSTNPTPMEADIRHAIAGNLCRCTGYDKIVRGIAQAAAADRQTTR